MDDKLSFKPTTMTGHTDLSLTISILALLPIASKGLSYTWMNKRSEVEFVIEKLDRAFASLDWLEAFPHTLVPRKHGYGNLGAIPVPGTAGVRVLPGYRCMRTPGASHFFQKKKLRVRVGYGLGTDRARVGYGWRRKQPKLHRFSRKN
jgi:hypothetical protein